jgi:hypothetical protein
VFQPSPQSVNQYNLSSFLVVVWAHHVDLIPIEVGCSIPEPVEPFIKAAPLVHPVVGSHSFEV